MPAPHEKTDIPIEAKKQGPGPAAYSLPTSVGKKIQDPTKRWQPAYSFGTRHKADANSNPAPHYVGVNHVVTRTGRVGAPQYSMKGRARPDKNVMADYPSPNSYNPQKPSHTSKYTIKGPYNYNPDRKMPGPQAYKTPAGIGLKDPAQRNNPLYSFGGSNPRFGIGSYVYDNAKTSGPAAYSCTNTDAFKSKGAQFSLSSRTNQYRDKTMKPGPGAYNVEKIQPRSGPKFSMGVRHSNYVMPVMTDVDI